MSKLRTIKRAHSSMVRRFSSPSKIDGAVGQLLRTDRENAHMTMKKASELMGWRHHQTLYAFESGRRIPSIQIIKDLCRIYGADVHKYRARFIDAFEIEWMKETGLW